MTTTAITPIANGGVLVASPNTSVREQLRRTLDDRGCAVQEVSGGADALAKLETGQWQLLFLDRRLPDLDAEEVIAIIKARFPGIEVILVESDGATVATQPDLGDRRSWLKPSVQTLERELERLTVPRPRSGNSNSTPLPGMLGNCEAMQRVYQLTRLVAPRQTTVLILGATGTGKELVARAIHKLSPRSSGAFAVVNCAAIPETLLESELFGYSRGAFTGAVQSYVGRIHSAQGGTLFLDEIGEMPLSLQAKLLRFLEQKEVQRLGSTDALRVDVRVVAATNANLAEQVATGHFRQDLYYRLSCFPIELPLLTERRRDVLPLAQHFLRATSVAMNSGVPKLSEEAVRKLESYAWPGNVRELHQVIERALILADGAELILPDHLWMGAAFRQPLKPEKSAEWRSA